MHCLILMQDKKIANVVALIIGELLATFVVESPALARDLRRAGHPSHALLFCRADS
jgi:hypothetical protein